MVAFNGFEDVKTFLIWVYEKSNHSSLSGLTDFPTKLVTKKDKAL